MNENYRCGECDNCQTFFRNLRDKAEGYMPTLELKTLLSDYPCEKTMAVGDIVRHESGALGYVRKDGLGRFRDGLRELNDREFEVVKKKELIGDNVFKLEPGQPSRHLTFGRDMIVTLGKREDPYGQLTTTGRLFTHDVVERLVTEPEFKWLLETSWRVGFAVIDDFDDIRRPVILELIREEGNLLALEPDSIDDVIEKLGELADILGR